MVGTPFILKSFEILHFHMSVEKLCIINIFVKHLERTSDI